MCLLEEERELTLISAPIWYEWLCSIWIFVKEKPKQLVVTCTTIHLHHGEILSNP